MSHRTKYSAHSAGEIFAMARFAYQKSRHDDHACDEERRAILAGQRRGTIRLNRLTTRANTSSQGLDRILAEMARRIQSGDKELAELCRRKAESVQSAQSKPLILLDDEE